MYQVARRTLAQNRARGVNISILVPPSEVPKKLLLLRMGRDIKRAGECESFDVVTRNGVTLLRTSSRAQGVMFHDIDGEELVRSDGENCHICLDSINNQKVIKLKACGHRVHFYCGLVNFMRNGLGCGLCRGTPQGLSHDSVNCPRCVRTHPGEEFDISLYTLAPCGHIHRRSCQEDFMSANAMRNVHSLTPDDLREMERQGQSKCYQCSTSGHRILCCRKWLLASCCHWKGPEAAAGAPSCPG